MEFIMKKIVVTGATGFLGRHVMPILINQYGIENVVGLSSGVYDLMKQKNVESMFNDHKPDVLVHLAAYSGGIGANREYPADFYFINTMLTALLFESAAKYKVKKVIYPMGGCSYPANASSPIGENQLWKGYPQEESAGYSTAKMMGVVASKSYRTQYGLNTAVLIPGNMYGEYDNFRDKESHVVPAMIRRYYEAMKNGDKEIKMWGTGRPTRDFVYAGDVAATFPYFIEEYNSIEPVNISTGTTITINKLALTIKRLTGFDGDIIWDSSKPDGQLEKIFDVAKLNSLGEYCNTSLHDGLSNTIAWFMKNYDDKTDGIRL